MPASGFSGTARCSGDDAACRFPGAPTLISRAASRGETEYTAGRVVTVRRSALRLLLLVHEPSVAAASDLEQLAEWVEELDDETRAVVVKDERDGNIRAELPDVPTLTVSFGPLRRLRPPRGPTLQGQLVSKSTEYRVLESMGIPVPRWVRLLPGRAPDLSRLGPYVVTKPDFGARGADVRIERRELVTWTPPRTQLTRLWGGRFNPRLAQDFVYTGPWPKSTRVVTLLGAALFAFELEASHDREPLHGSADFHGQSIVSSGRGCTFKLAIDDEALRLAERAHAAFPRVPLLGFDIVRDAETRQLFVLEANSLGYVWDFSSPSGLGIQAEFGFDLEAQLDGRRRAAARLAEACAMLAA